MDQNAKNWAMMLHFSLLGAYVVPIAGVIAPILIWQLKKNEIPELDAHGKMIANYLLSMVIYSLVAGLLTLLLIGFLLLLVLVVVSLVYPIIGGIKANNGEFWKYPLIIEFIK